MHNVVVGECFCEGCRTQKLTRVKDHGYTNQELYAIVTRDLVEKEGRRLEKLHKTTLQQIIYGKAYEESSLENTYFKSWAKNEANFAHLSDKAISKLCTKVN